MSKHGFTIVIAVIIAVSLLLQLFTFQVRQNEEAVVLTFGRPADESRKAGWHLQWPWPIQAVHKFDTRLHVYEGKLEEVPTKDRYNIIAAVCVGWEVHDVFKFDQNFGQEEREKGVENAWVQLRSIVRNRVNAMIGQYKLRELVSLNTADLKYDELEKVARAKAEKDALETYGIALPLLKIKRLELPDSVKGQVYSRMKQERSKEATNIRSQGTQQAAAIKASADSEAKQILSRAEARADAIRTEGEVEAAKYYDAFRKNPELAIYLRKIRAFKKIAESDATFILDTKTAPLDILVEESPKPRKVGK